MFVLRASGTDYDTDPALARRTSKRTLSFSSMTAGNMTPGDIHILVAQGNDADTSPTELTPQ
jgi:hypothetical protein